MTQRNEKKLRKLFEGFYEPFSDYFTMQIGDEDAARTIVAEAFGYVYHHYGDLRSTNSARLLDLIIRKSEEGCVSYCKEQQVKQEAVAAITEASDRVEDNMEEILVMKDIYKVLTGVEKKLPKRQKQFLEVFFSGVETEEGARIMGIEKSTYRNTKGDVIDKMRNALKQAGYLQISILAGIGLHLLYYQIIPLTLPNL